MPTHNQQALRDLALRQPSVARAKLVLPDGTEMPFAGKLSTITDRKPKLDIVTPREDEIDMDGPKTHRVVCVVDTKVALDSKNDPATSFIRYREQAWVTGDIAREMERKGLVTIVDTREAPAVADEPAPSRDPADALKKPQPINPPKRSRTLSAAEKARREAHSERLKALNERRRREAYQAGIELEDDDASAAG